MMKVCEFTVNIVKNNNIRKLTFLHDNAALTQVCQEENDNSLFNKHL